MKPMESGTVKPNLIKEEDKKDFATSQPITEGFAHGDELAQHLSPGHLARTENATMKQASGKNETALRRGKETGVSEGRLFVDKH